MRMRPKKNRVPRLEAVNGYFASTDENGMIDISASFPEKRERLLLELGCGKGTFAVALSERETDADIIAVEKVPDVILMAMEKADKAGRDNLKFASFDIAEILEKVPGHCADAVYINFCDPWPRKKNAKRRLTSPLFLERYKKILKEGARIYFKTDNIGLFEYSLETFPACGYVTENVCFDLHSDPMNENNIVTEYEKNFSEKGFKINYLEAFLPAK